MAWSELTEPGSVDRVLLDPPFMIRIRLIETYNINALANDLTNGKQPEPLRAREEIRLWNGALFVGCFDNRDEVKRIVRQLREKAMNHASTRRHTVR